MPYCTGVVTGFTGESPNGVEIHCFVTPVGDESFAPYEEYYYSYPNFASITGTGMMDAIAESIKAGIFADSKSNNATMEDGYFHLMTFFDR